MAAVIEAVTTYSLRCPGCNAEMATSASREVLLSGNRDRNCIACSTPHRTREYLLGRIDRLFRILPEVRFVCLCTSYAGIYVSVNVDRDITRARRPGRALCDMLGLRWNALGFSYGKIGRHDVLVYRRDSVV